MNTLLLAPKKQNRKTAMLPAYSRNIKIICNLSGIFEMVCYRKCPGAPKKNRSSAMSSKFRTKTFVARNLFGVPNAPLRNNEKAHASPSKCGHVNLERQFNTYMPNGLFD